MCTLIMLYRLLKKYPIIAVHNRYARVNSLEEPPQVLTASKGFRVYCPVDVNSRGTWIGFNSEGLFIAATDQHTGPEIKPYRSRGLLILDALRVFSKASEALNYIKRELSKGYRRGNFIIADKSEGFHLLHDECIEIRKLESGLYVLTNITLRDWVKLDGTPKDLLEYAEQRRRRALDLVSSLEPSTVDDALNALKQIASDHGCNPGRGSICYHNGLGWYMSSSTIIAMATEVKKSKILYCRGNPCKSRFTDYSFILSLNGRLEVAGKSSKLLGKTVALCVTGSVAAIEAPKLARELRRHGAKVFCYMTEAALEYGVSVKAMEWATGRKAVLKLTGDVEHLKPYDLVIVYPATANTICKIAAGIADNAVTILCAATKPTKLLIAPAMNIKLYESSLLREALDKLSRMGATILKPRISEGAAKVARVEETVDYAIRLISESILRGRGILILSGPSRYDLDAVRYISNKSTGRLGYWLTKEAFWRGCRVKNICGPGEVKPPTYIEKVDVYTTDDFLKETMRELKTGLYEAAIFAAAILDFKPETRVEGKVKSGAEWGIKLKPTVKVVEKVRERFPALTIVAFKLEHKAPKNKLIENAFKRLKQLNAQLIVANNISEIKGDRHRAYLIYADGSVEEHDGSKAELAERIFNALEHLAIKHENIETGNFK